MEFACWVIKILVIVILGFNGCQRPLDNQGPRSLNKHICDSKLRVCIFLGCLYMLVRHGTPKWTNPCHAFPQTMERRIAVFARAVRARSLSFAACGFWIVAVGQLRGWAVFFSSPTVDWLCRCLHGSWNIWYIHIFCISSHCNFIYLVFCCVWRLATVNSKKEWQRERERERKRERERERSDTPQIGRVMPVFVFQQNVRKANKDLDARNWGK